MKFSAKDLDHACADWQEDDNNGQILVSIHHRNLVYSTRITPSPSPTWLGCVDLVELVIGEKPLKMCYKDGENDMISFDTDEEWRMAINVAKQLGNRLDLFVTSYTTPTVVLEQDKIMECVTSKTSDQEQSVSVESHGVSSSDNELNSPVSPPMWFINYMEKFRADMTADIVKKINRRMQKLFLNDTAVDQDFFNLTIDERSSQLQCGAVRKKILNSDKIDDQSCADNKYSSSSVCNGLDIASTSQVSSVTKDFPVYHGILCCICHKEIVGIRYKCGNCLDFDLCAACESVNQIHIPDHVFIKIRKPTIGAGLTRKTGKAVPLLKHVLYPRDDPQAVSKSGRKKFSLKDKCKRERFLQRPVCVDLSVYQRSGCSGWTSALKKSAIEPLKAIRSTMNAEFIHDETVPDGTKFLPGVTFTKSWCVVNRGSRPWNEYTLLKFLWGTKGFSPNLLEVVVPSLQPNEHGTISVEYSSPLKPGFYESHWNFVHKGHLFGHRIWCSIEVIDLEADAYGSSLDVKKQPGVVVLEPESGEKAVVSVPLVTAHPIEHDNVNKDVLDLGDVEGRKTKFLSHTTTPNNTPFVLSPPKSPEPLEQENNLELESLSDSDGLVGDDDVQALLNSDVTSVISWNSSDSETEYVVVPVPPCFNYSPVENEVILCPTAATDQRGKESSSSSSVMFIGSDGEEISSAKSPGTDESVSCDHSYAKPCSSGSVRELEDCMLTGIVLESKQASDKQNEVNIFSETDEENNNSECVSTKNEGLAENVNVQTDPIHSEAFDETEPRPSTPVVVTQPPSFCNCGKSSLLHTSAESGEDAARVVNVLPEGLVSAAATIFNSARTAFSAMQWVPPPHPDLPQSVVSPQMTGISPTVRNTSAESVASDPSTLRVNDLLCEMGFYNVQLNFELAERHSGNVEKILDDLLLNGDMNWYLHRH